MRPEQTRTYDRASSIVFLKTHEAFGGLSNMAGGFPLRVNGIRILTSEALYQACRFPHCPQVQTLIIEQKSPMTAKMKSKPYRHDSRPDWNQARVNIMRWCLRVKLAQNWITFSKLLLETGERPIVEESRKDSFWGAVPNDDGTLSGMNVLGRLLMELREMVKQQGREAFMRVEPLAIPDFLLANKPIEPVVSRGDIESRRVPAIPVPAGAAGDGARQSSLFGESAVMEAPPAPYLTPAKKGVQIADLKPYPEYKESGLPWLGQVPEHWELRPAFGVYMPNHERNRGLKEKTVLSLSYGRIVVKPLDKLHGLVPDSFETYQIVNPGYIVLRTTDLQNDHTSLRVGMVRDRGIITSAYLALRTVPGIVPEFGYQFLNVWDTSKAIYGYGSGLRQNLDFTHFKRMPVAIPPLDEQAAIVRFLDWANGRLERTIRAKRKVIALLNEQKQVIIQHAVTRGRDPSASLKPSGIPWLGDIPQHWEIKQLRRLVRYGTRITYGIVQAGPDVEGGTPYIRTSDMKGQELPPSGYLRTSREIDSAYRRSKVDPGDLVVAIRATLGKGLLVPNCLAGANLTQGTARIAPSKVVSSEFLFHAFNSRYCQESIRMVAKGTTFLEITLEALRQLSLAIPPLSEQMQLSAAIFEQTQPLSELVERTENEITLLREYRTRLVADVVTGKLDVREAAARLPDEAPLDSIEEDVELDDEMEAADEKAVA